MKVAVVLAVLALVGLSSAQIVTRHVDLRVDHFSPIDRRSFDGRYFSNPQHWLPGGPIFIYVSGGFEVYDEFLGRGAIFEIAEETRGHLFSLEHRFYGTSQPTEDTSVENLRFLTVHQALADLAQFITFIRANYYGASNSRVVLWGRGYGGALAVWARQKFPNLIDGAWASSAPINAIVGCHHFMANTIHTIEQIGGPECGQTINGAFRMIEDAIRRRDTEYVEERLRLCSPIDLDIEEDVARLFYGIAADIGYSFVSNARYPEIDEKCRIIQGLDTPDNPAENDLDAFARWFVDEFNRNVECLQYNNTAIVQRYQQVNWNTVSTIAGRRQNFWLQCTQLGQFPVADEGRNHPFGWRFDLNFFERWCADVFGHELFADGFMERSIRATNAFFGGLNPHVYRVFFTHGEMDPRRSLGPNADINDKSPVVVMSLQSAGRDFGSPSETDYAVLIETKARARELIIEWIIDSIIELPTDPPATSTSGPGPAVE